MRLYQTRREAFSVVEIVIVLAVVALLATGLAATFMGKRDARLDREWKLQCAAHMEQLGQAVMLYTLDYDGKYPPSSKIISRGWVELLVPYSGRELFHCPAAATSGPNGPSYFFNARLNGIEISKIRDPQRTIVIGDGDGTTSQTISSLPNEWRKQLTSPSFRHDGGAYYSFADGHYKWEKPEKIDTTLSSKESLSFAWK